MKLETSQDLLQRLRARYSRSWYGLAPLLGAHEKSIANWKNGRTVVDRRFAPRIAELLEEPAEYVLACLEAERESDPAVRKVLERIALKFRSHAASILLAALASALLAKPGISAAGALSEQCRASASVYYGKSKLERWLAWLKNKALRPISRAPWTWTRERSGIGVDPLSSSRCLPACT